MAAEGFFSHALSVSVSLPSFPVSLCPSVLCLSISFSVFTSVPAPSLLRVSVFLFSPVFLSVSLSAISTCFSLLSLSLPLSASVCLSVSSYLFLFLSLSPLGPFSNVFLPFFSLLSPSPLFCTHPSLCPQLTLVALVWYFCSSSATDSWWSF